MGELKHRKQIGVNLPNEMVEQLKSYSDKTGIPMSRVVEKALDLFFKTDHP